ncbi:hypothetical protein ACFYO2_34300 [Streptomyces sp. NPDC006602]|uniref:hypothetical protein n=1 Tax=Streptomyces sp. NPDC006602 TaxID=3364751 RepID=UPI0036A65597
MDLTNTGPLTLLTGYQTPAAIRRIGRKRLETWLRNRRVLRADQLAEAAVQTAERQRTSLPGEKLAAQLVHTLAKEVMTLNQQVAEIDKRIEARFREHSAFDVITSLPGMGPILGAEFLAATGGERSVPDAQPVMRYSTRAYQADRASTPRHAHPGPPPSPHTPLNGEGPPTHAP